MAVERRGTDEMLRRCPLIDASAPPPVLPPQIRAGYALDMLVSAQIRCDLRRLPASPSSRWRLMWCRFHQTIMVACRLKSRLWAFDGACLSPQESHPVTGLPPA